MLISGVVLGVVAGWATGGRIARLGDLRISWWPLLAVAIAIRIVAPMFGDSLIAWVIGFALIIIVALVDRHLPGMAAIASGAALNLLVVLANGAMAVDPAAAATVGATIHSDGLHRALREGDVLTFLADRIPVAPIAGVYSVGDVFLALGGFWVPFAAMRRR
ncbi:MAG: DUF5317 family protein [Chloroflexi bacterium]|nr:DUF5317 family protein [Chloroflexota bacterium]